MVGALKLRRGFEGVCKRTCIEDAEALKFTEEQRLLLFHSFRSVKFEWSDLDGMRSHTRPKHKRKHTPVSPTHVHARRLRSPHQRPPRLVRKDDTIRGHAHSLVSPQKYYGSGRRGGEGGDEDEDAWVDDEEDDNATFIAGEDGEDEDDGLATPVPRAWGLPPTYDEEEPATPIPEVYEREATPTPYDYPGAYGGLQDREEREREQVGGKRKR
ncbi:hypothetical protein B0H19DRAFT_1279756 [Mycena capillaripes]|nr:hypothetical protein B0H19DRAFT_1279756 [Mycena capillaripes]